MSTHYTKVMIKLSGESLASNRNPLDPKNVQSIASRIAELANLDIQIAIVIGGGNFFRGRDAEQIGIDRHDGDYMGMLGTIINSMALQSALERKGKVCSILSSIEVKGVVANFSRRKALEYLHEGRIVIFAGGTGHPYFSTDTTAALRAAEIGSEVILMAKNGVDGIYSGDPSKNKDAVKFSSLSYLDFIKKDLKVMDNTAVTLCKDNGIEIIVFDASDSKALINNVNGIVTGTIVFAEEKHG
jgi:uridylate kinase